MQYRTVPVDRGAEGLAVGLGDVIMAWAIAAPVPVSTFIPTLPPVLAAASCRAGAASNCV
jgi:hypothetical protein